MKQYTQLQTSDPAKGVIGDCLRTCIACLMHIEPADVPHFSLHGSHFKEQAAVQEWLKPFGFALYQTSMPYSWLNEQQITKCYYILTGPSPRDADRRHSVIAMDGEIVWDPHPGRAGLAGDPDTWYVNLLIKL